MLALAYVPNNKFQALCIEESVYLFREFNHEMQGGDSSSAQTRDACDIRRSRYGPLNLRELLNKIPRRLIGDGV
jgi:hypothetical protein